MLRLPRLVVRRLFRTHVLRRTDECAESRVQRFVCQFVADCLGYAEIDHFGYGPVVVQGHQHIRRFDIAVDYPFGVCMLNRLADRDEQFETLVRCESAVVAKLRDRHSFDEFHDEVWSARRGRPGIEHFGDIRMIHHRDRLPFRFETGKDRPRIEAEFDDLDRNGPFDRLELLGYVDFAHAARPDRFEQLVSSVEDGSDKRIGKW